MAIRDWKNLERKNDYVSYIKKNQDLLIISYSLGGTRGYAWIWEVSIKTRLSSPLLYASTIILKEFKTKSQALKFAKNYMRTH